MFVDEREASPGRVRTEGALVYLGDNENEGPKNEQKQNVNCQYLDLFINTQNRFVFWFRANTGREVT